jgi:aminoglycoside phosphotransferase family enzyme/predicted kinase
MMCASESIRLIEALQQPAVYGHPAQGIELLQTHISWVLLAGDFAYKIKKPVDLSFADFSTLQKRERFCHEELRLNRRLAPKLYLDVVPITGMPESPQLNGAGRPIEFAVKMKRFPQHVLLNHVIERGELLPEHIDRLARQVAGFHSQCPIADANTHFGDLKAIRQPVDENFQRLLCSVKDHHWHERIKRLNEWSRRELDQRRHDFIRRKRNGSIRECHGDMHLGNMILDGNEVVIFDCIEFNESFRWIDVISEIAFLVMDLEDRGRPDLAHRFLNGYLEWTGDYEGLVVLPFYLSYRALVRAKVDEIRFEQDDLNAAERNHLIDDLHGYLEQAQRYTMMPPPMLIITHGVSGSGKTSGTQPLLEELGAIRIRSDVERKRLLGLDPLRRTDLRIDNAYSDEINQQTYNRLAQLATAIIRAGFPVIVDATFLRRSDRDQFRNLSEELKVPVVIVSFQAGQKELRRRVLARKTQGHDASEAGLDVLERQIRVQEPLQNDELAAAIVVDDNAFSTAKLLREAIEQFRGDPRFVAH